MIVLSDNACRNNLGAGKRMQTRFGELRKIFVKRRDDAQPQADFVCLACSRAFILLHQRSFTLIPVYTFSVWSAQRRPSPKLESELLLRDIVSKERARACKRHSATNQLLRTAMAAGLKTIIALSFVCAVPFHSTCVDFDSNFRSSPSDSFSSSSPQPSSTTFSRYSLSLPM